MTDEPGKPDEIVAPKICVSDPDAVPVRVVDAIGFCGIIGTNVALILTTNVARIDDQGQVKSEHIIAARLRLDINQARFLRDILSKEIDLLSPPEGKGH